MGKIAPKTVKLIKEAYKDKCFDDCTIFRQHGDFKKRCLFAEMIPKPGHPKSVTMVKTLTLCGQSCKKSANGIWGDRGIN